MRTCRLCGDKHLGRRILCGSCEQKLESKYGVDYNHVFFGEEPIALESFRLDTPPVDTHPHILTTSSRVDENSQALEPVHGFSETDTVRRRPI